MCVFHIWIHTHSIWLLCIVHFSAVQCTLHTIHIHAYFMWCLSFFKFVKLFCLKRTNTNIIVRIKLVVLMHIFTSIQLLVCCYCWCFCCCFWYLLLFILISIIYVLVCHSVELLLFGESENVKKERIPCNFTSLLSILPSSFVPFTFVLRARFQLLHYKNNNGKFPFIS